MLDFVTKQKDTRNALKAILKEDGEAVDLTGCNVKFVMKWGNETAIDRSATINDASVGEVWVVFTEDELDNPGRWKGEFIVTFAGGKKETYPNQDSLEIKILSNLGE